MPARRATALIATGAVAIAAGAPAAAQAAPSIPGFTPEHSAEQRKAEQRFQRAISAPGVGRFSARSASARS